jgi:hypothetical protein
LVTAPLAQEPVGASRTFVDRLAHKELLPTEGVGEIAEQDAIRLAMAESERLLAAAWGAVPATSDSTKAPLAHWADGGAIVTRIVTHGQLAHAPTACANVGTWVSSRTK